MKLATLELHLTCNEKYCINDKEIPCQFLSNIDTEQAYCNLFFKKLASQTPARCNKCLDKGTLRNFEFSPSKGSLMISTIADTTIKCSKSFCVNDDNEKCRFLKLRQEDKTQFKCILFNSDVDHMFRLDACLLSTVVEDLETLQPND